MNKNIHTFIGIDPGIFGAIAIIQFDKLVLTSAFNADRDACKILNNYNPDHTIVGIEELHALFGVTSKSTFMLGKQCGKWEGSCCSLGFKTCMIPPKDWQESVTIPPIKPVTKGLEKKEADKIKKAHKQAIKDESIRAANDMFPEANITLDGIADAVNICVFLRYLYRQNRLQFL